MQAATEARKTALRIFRDKDELRRKIKALQTRAGYANREMFAQALGMEPRRLTYIISNPECIKLSESVCIQALAIKYDCTSIFDFTLAEGVHA